MAGSGGSCEAGLGLELGFAVVGQECHELVFVYVGADYPGCFQQSAPAGATRNCCKLQRGIDCVGAGRCKMQLAIAQLQVAEGGTRHLHDKERPCDADGAAIALRGRETSQRF